eukprot:m.264218 g.264218  ORF g.264218 m.264218 type:complete len:1038 (-) comp22771_c1_seq4:30-3143(-)
MSASPLLVQLLQNTLHPDTLEAAAAQLAQLHGNGDFPLQLLAVVTAPEVPLAVQQAAAVHLKNLLARRYHHKAIAREDGLLLLECLLDALSKMEEHVISRQIALCLTPILGSAQLCSHAVGEIMRRFQTHWGRAEEAKTVAYIACVKLAFRCALNSQEVAERSVAMLTRVFLHVIELMAVVTRDNMVTLRKLLCGVARLAAHVCPVEVPLEEKHVQALLEIFMENIQGGEQEQVQRWKAKARVVDCWHSLVTKCLPFSADRPHRAAVLEAAYKSLVEQMLSMLHAYSAIAPEDERDSEPSRARGKCIVAVMECLALDTAVRPQLREQVLAPHLERLLTRSLFSLLRLHPGDDALLRADPSEYANRLIEEIKGALSCVHGYPSPDECESGCADRQQPGSNTVTTPRSAAMRLIRELQLHCSTEMLTRLLQMVLKGLHDSTVNPDQDAHAIVEKVSMRVAALRTFASVADNAASKHNHTVNALMLEVLLNWALPDCQAQPHRYNEHVRCVACTVLARFIPFLQDQGEGAVERAVQALVTLLGEPSEAVRTHALTALRDGLGTTPVRLYYRKIAPALLQWLLSLIIEHRIESEQLIEAMNSCLWHFPGVLGLPPTASLDNPSPEEQQQAIIKHTAVCRYFIDQFHRATRGDDENSEEMLRRSMCAVHAVVMSCPREPEGWVTAEMLEVVLPVALGLLQPRLLLFAMKHVLDGEIGDLLAAIPRNQADLWFPLATAIMQAVVNVPAAAEMLLPQLCEVLHVSGSQLLFAQGRLQQHSTQLQSLLRTYIVAQNDDLLAQCWAADLMRTLFIVSACEGKDTVAVTYFGHRERGTVPRREAQNFRQEYIILLMRQLTRACDFPGDEAPVLAQLPVRILGALSATLLVDPHATLTLLQSQQAGLEHGLTLLLTTFMRLLNRFPIRRALDMRITALAMAAFISITRVQALPIQAIQAPIVTGVCMLDRIRRAQKFMEEEDTQDDLEPCLDFDACDGLDELLEEEETDMFSMAMSELDRAQPELLAQFYQWIGPEISGIVRRFIAVR